MQRGEALITGSAAMIQSIVDTFLGLVGWFISLIGDQEEPALDLGDYEQADLKVLNCLVRPTRQKKGKSFYDVLSVEICGSIHAPAGTEHAAVCISITDVTDGPEDARPVHSRLTRWRTKDSPVFHYEADLGKLTSEDMMLSDWVAVATIDPDWLMSPYKGARTLRFDVSILSSGSGQQFASAECDFGFENAAFGYIDLQENAQRIKTLAVALAFAVSAADNKLYDCEVEVIKEWARENIDTAHVSEAVKHRFERALAKTVGFFRDGNQVDCHKICAEMVEIAPLAERYDTLALCLCVAQANGTATSEELDLLKNLANWLRVDMDRFRAMMQKILPSDMHEVKDMEVILGVTSNMSSEDTRKRLNREYRKWNARVTNSDPEIQNQADHMLRFIAEARQERIS
ncbi:MAG: TerB family tellurite resistance protein [Planctomycetota bacterium]|jgi:hypothetical protein